MTIPNTKLVIMPNAKPATMSAWAVISNTNLTDGRGKELILHVCKLRATARRLARKRGVQGSDAEVRKVDTFAHDRCDYGPITLVWPQPSDEKEEVRIHKTKKALARAEKLGLTPEEIEALADQVFLS